MTDLTTRLADALRAYLAEGDSPDCSSAALDRMEARGHALREALAAYDAHQRLIAAGGTAPDMPDIPRRGAHAAEAVMEGWIAFADRWPPKSSALDDPSIATTDRVIVTNNIDARDRMGRMANVWLCMPIQDKDEIVGFTESDRKLHGLTHWHPLPAPSSLTPPSAENGNV